MKTVVVGLSGGVDSSVTAALLKEQGFSVIGLFMKNWEESDAKGVCQSAKDFKDVESVCTQLNIPYYTVNFVEEYRERVFSQFLKECESGLTPNPDILCNREIKFDLFLKKALSLGADALATGHYCRLSKSFQLLKGTDLNKDQSYFLHAVSSSAFENVLFPIGHLTKTQVRALAKKYDLPTSEKKDSTGICFIGKRNFKQFLSPYLGFQPGPILTLSGNRVGTHDGVAYHTLGQRRGLGLGGEGEAWYVVQKDPHSCTVFVERGSSHPALYADELFAINPTWVSSPPSFPLHCQAKIRYRQQDVDCQVFPSEENTLSVSFKEPQRAITPGQSIVFYQNEVCLGGAVISQAGPSYYEMKKPLPQSLRSFSSQTV